MRKYHAWEQQPKRLTELLTELCMCINLRVETSKIDNRKLWKMPQTIASPVSCLALSISTWWMERMKRKSIRPSFLITACHLNLFDKTHIIYEWNIVMITINVLGTKFEDVCKLFEDVWDKLNADGLLEHNFHLETLI